MHLWPPGLWGLLMSPEELEAANRIITRLGIELEPWQRPWVAQQLKGTAAFQRELLAVHADQLRRSIGVQLGELAQRLLSWRGPWRW